MEPFLAITELFSHTSLHKVANSALPNAPVQPYVEPRRRIRRSLAMARRTIRRPTIDMRPARYNPGC